MPFEFEFDSQYSFDAAHSVGFNESVDTVPEYCCASTGMAKAKLISSDRIVARRREFGCILGTWLLQYAIEFGKEHNLLYLFS